MTAARGLFGVLFLFGAVAFQSANACTPLRYVDPIGYAGGDLAQQIAAGAETIQIVEVRDRYLLARYDSLVERFWHTGRRPSGAETEARYRDIYIFELEVVETLKDGSRTSRPIRARAIDQSADPTLWQSLGYMANSVLDTPAPEGFVVSPVAVDPYSGTSCHSPLALSEGNRYLILRDERGDILTPSYEDGQWRNFLPINLRNERTGEQFVVHAPGVMEVSPMTSELVARIRAALQVQ